MKYSPMYLIPLLLLISIFACSLSGPNPESEPVYDFDVSAVKENDTISIDVTYDLKGESVHLPPHVSINYGGGRIINGTLIFDNGVIDGQLLNHQLEIGGTVRLKSSTFVFEKSRWNIIEGRVPDTMALKNRETLQRAIDRVKSLGAAVFQINNLDAYFLVTSERNLILAFETSIRIPSNFTLEMTNNTHLRVQPNKYSRYVLLEIRDVSNVHIRGGHLHGDRDEHDYTPLSINSGQTNKTHEWGHLLNIASGINITIKNVHMSYASGDGLNIHSTKHAYKPDYIGSKDIVVSHCTFDSNRRNNLSITDGFNIIVENNEFLNAGIDTLRSKGTAPKYGLVVEAFRGRDDAGNLIEYQRAKDIIIRNNTERGSAAGAMTVCIGEYVTIENNTVENTIGFSMANNVKIKNNTINVEYGDTGIGAGHPRYSDTVFANEVFGNTIISNRGIGAMLHAEETKIYSNSFVNCKTAIGIRDVIGSKVYDNVIRSDIPVSYGIMVYSCFANDLKIQNNDIKTTFKPIFFNNVNTGADHQNYTVNVSGNTLFKGQEKVGVEVSPTSNGIIVQ